MSTPYSIRKIPAQQTVNWGFLNARRSGHADFAFDAGAAADSWSVVDDVDAERRKK
jgi:hypothetical protein